MSSQASESTGTQQSTSTPGILPFLQQLAEFSQGLASQTYNWAADTFAKNSQLTDQNVQSFLDTSAKSLAQATNDTSRYQNIFQPEENQLVQDANSYASDARIKSNMGSAESTTEQDMEAGRQNSLRDLQAYGIDPSSGRYAELDQAERAKQAAAAAGAGQQSRLATEATGRALRSEAIQVGERYPGQITNELNTAMQGVSGAENAALGNANTGANMFGAAAPFIKFPSATNTTQSTGAQQSKSASNSGGSGGSGGAKASPPMQFQPFSGGAGAGNRSGSGSNGMTGAEPGFYGWQPGQGPQDTGGQDNGWMTDSNTDPFANMDNTGGNQDPNIANNDQTYNPDPNNMGIDTGTTDAGWSDPTGGNQDPGYGFDPTGGSQSPSGGSDTYSQDSSWSDPGYSGGTSAGYVAGGDVHGSVRNVGTINAKGGGQVPTSASPSGGQRTDDVRAHLNAHEFVIPKDVAQWKGQEFFQKLIMQSRKSRMGAPAKPTQGSDGPSAYCGGAM